MEVADWLGRLGLSQYAKVFADNQIDDAVLPDLTPEDLKELGINLLGHRRKLLTAIEGLRARAEPGAPAEAGLRPADGTGAAPERRHLTVMFCELAGGAALAARLDPEDLREVMRRYHSVVTEAVRAQDGFVAQYLANGALIYFGFPAAQEDDAERAVRAAVMLRDGAQALQVDGTVLEVRAGLASGLVIAGDRAEGSKASHEQQIMGETPNRAARLQALAGPGEIVIDAVTRRLIGRMFHLAPRAPANLKGFAEPVECWNVLGTSEVESRFEALRSGETPLVGRDEELELLERRWQQIKGGTGRVVLISGEAGLGKSRLISAFERTIGNENALELRYFCSPQHANTALHPVTAHVTRAANFAVGDTPEQKLEKLGRLAAKADDVPFLADLLSLPLPADARTDQLAPQEKRQKTIAALLAKIDQLATKQPLFILVEDMHWVDATTQELVDQLIPNLDRKPILFVLTYRPQYRPPWTGQSNVTSVSLSRLRLDDRATLIRSLIGNAGLSPETIDEIAERTDGIPLYAEELTKAVIESGNVGLLSAASDPATQIPATLHASLMARLDHLGTQARETAQLGAVIGREFSYPLLRALAQRSEAFPQNGIDQALKSLDDSGLVLARGSPPASVYTFKHALVHEAAHSTLLRAQRQKLHVALVGIIGADEKTPPELLAYHFAEAGEHERAAQQYLRAARRANEQSAVREALQNLDEADRQLRNVAETERREPLQLEIESERIVPTLVFTGFGSAEVRAVLDRAEALADHLGAEKPLFLLWYRYMDYAARADLKTALPLGLAFARRAEGELTIISDRLLGNCYMCLGRFNEALLRFQAVLAQDPARSTRLRFSYVYDSQAFASINMALTLLVLGLPDEAEKPFKTAFSREKELGHPVTTAWVLAVGLVYALMINDRGSIERLSARLSEIAQKFKMTHFHRLARVNIAYLEALRNNPAAGLAEVETCLSEWLQTGYRYFLPIIWIVQIRIQLLIKDKIDAAFKTVKVALAHVAETDETMFAAELNRLNGVIALASKSDRDEPLAEQAFQRAIEIAREQDAKLLEL
ncbi:MAG: AAA family ATPase, partial [Methylobacteriaceae bacterium]|nr:AAA family ATPase [Methylobacteriaceae bacterium]